MTDTYIYLIREKDWDSDNYLPGTTPSTDSHDQVFREHAEFQAAVAALGARIVGANALQNASYGGIVARGAGDRAVEDAVYTDSPYTDSSELITGYYAVEVDDEPMARTVAALVPSGGTVEWRKVFPIG